MENFFATYNTVLKALSDLVVLGTIIGAVYRSTKKLKPIAPEDGNFVAKPNQAVNRNNSLDQRNIYALRTKYANPIDSYGKMSRRSMFFTTCIMIALLASPNLDNVFSLIVPCIYLAISLACSASIGTLLFELPARIKGAFFVIANIFFDCLFVFSYISISIVFLSKVVGERYFAIAFIICAFITYVSITLVVNLTGSLENKLYERRKLSFYRAFLASGHTENEAKYFSIKEARNLLHSKNLRFPCERKLAKSCHAISTCAVLLLLATCYLGVFSNAKFGFKVTWIDSGRTAQTSLINPAFRAYETTTRSEFGALETTTYDYNCFGFPIREQQGENTTNVAYSPEGRIYETFLANGFLVETKLKGYFIEDPLHWEQYAIRVDDSGSSIVVTVLNSAGKKSQVNDIDDRGSQLVSRTIIYDETGRLCKVLIKRGSGESSIQYYDGKHEDRLGHPRYPLPVYEEYYENGIIESYAIYHYPDKMNTCRDRFDLEGNIISEHEPVTSDEEFFPFVNS